MTPPPLPSPTRTATLGDELVLVASDAPDAITLAVDDPRFGRIATVRLDVTQADQLAQALWMHVDRHDAERR